MGLFKKAKKSLEIPIAGVAAAEIAKHLERTQIAKYHTKGGHGFAAEEANAFSDRIRFRKVEFTGPSNAAAGPDRIVKGVAIQNKYLQTPQATVDATFDSNMGLYRYESQLLEVPNDQYEECLKIMRERIAQGRVPGITDPNEAEQIIKRGNVTYKQARNIARAGNVDSLVFDTKTQSVTSAYIFGISFAVHYAQQRWSGERNQDAIQTALRSALASGSTTFITGLITAQILRMRAAAVGAVVMRSGVKTIYQTSLLGKTAIEKLAAASLGRAVYGAAALNHVAKLLRSNIITSTVATTLIIVPDFYRAALAQSISWPQLTKNLVVNASGMAGGIAGWLSGAAIGAALGSAVPVIGTAAGGVMGGLCGALMGGTASSAGAKIVADQFIEDDVKRMLSILQSTVEELAWDYLLSEKEIQILSESVRENVSPKWIRQMYQAGGAARSDEDRRSFAYNYFDEICLKIIQQRLKVQSPSEEEIRSQIDLIAQAIANSTGRINYFLQYVLTWLCLTFYRARSLLLREVVNIG